MAVATLYDLRSREIPDWISVTLLLWAIIATSFALDSASWLGFVSGGACGLLVGLPLFAAGAFGGGDVKLVAALGAALGPVALVSMLFWVAVVGGLLAMLAMVRGKRDLAYVPAIALGLLIYLVRSEFLSNANLS